jgi:hypothetical protein
LAYPRCLVSDLLQFGFVGDPLEVVAGRVRLFAGAEFLGGEFDVERGDRVVDLGGRVGADERCGDDRLAVQPGQGNLGPGSKTGETASAGSIRWRFTGRLRALASAIAAGTGPGR